MIGLFARLDPHGKVVFLRRERAGGVRSKRAGRVVGLIEIEDDLAVLGEFGVKEPSGRIGLLSGGEVAKDVEELFRPRLFDNRIEPHFFTGETEYGETRIVGLLGLADDVQNRNLTWLGDPF